MRVCPDNERAPALLRLLALSGIVAAIACMAATPPLGRPDVVLVWPGRIERAAEGRELPRHGPKGLGLVCKFGIAQAVTWITGGHGSKAGSAQ